MRARERLRARRAHPVGRDHGPARAHRADPRLEGTRRAAEPAGDRRPLPVPDRDRRDARRPTSLLPDCFQNHGNYVVSLGNVVRWLAQQAEALGVEIFPGFPAAEVLYNDDGSVKGVATGNLGIGKDGEPTENFQLGMELHAQVHDLRRRRARPPRPAADRQVQARRGQRPAELRHRHQGAVGDRPGASTSPASWCTPPAGRWTPTPTAARSSTTSRTTRSTLGFVVGLDYTNPYLSARSRRFQRWKTHPAIRAYLEGGKRLGYGARAITAGGLHVAAEDGVPGRRAGRLRRRLPERQRASRAATRRSRPACWPPRRRSTRVHGRPPARRADGLPGGLREELAARRSCTRRATSSSGSRRACTVGTLMTGIEQCLLRGNAPVDAAPPAGRPRAA